MCVEWRSTQPVPKRLVSHAELSEDNPEIKARIQSVQDGYLVSEQSVVVEYLGCAVLTWEQLRCHFNFFCVFIQVGLGVGRSMATCLISNVNT